MKKEEKESIIQDFQKQEKDTGSAEVQIGVLTKEIKDTVEHLKKHRHDFSARRGLLRKVARRRKLLRYLQYNDPKSYEKIIKKL